LVRIHKIDQKPVKSDKGNSLATTLVTYNTVLVNFINLDLMVCQLAKKIGWEELEKNLTPYFPGVGW